MTAHGLATGHEAVPFAGLECPGPEMGPSRDVVLNSPRMTSMLKFTYFPEHKAPSPRSLLLGRLIHKEDGSVAPPSGLLCGR